MKKNNKLYEKISSYFRNNENNVDNKKKDFYIIKIIICSSIWFVIKQILNWGGITTGIVEAVFCLNLAWSILEDIDFSKLFMMGPGGKDILNPQDRSPKPLKGPGGKNILNPTTESVSPNVQPSSDTAQAPTSSQPETTAENQNLGENNFSFINKIPQNYLNSELYNSYRDNPRSEESIKAHISFFQEKKIVTSTNVHVIRDENFKEMRGAFYYREGVLRYNQGDVQRFYNMENESVMVDGFRVPKYCMNPRSQIFDWKSRYAVLPCGIILNDIELVKLRNQFFDMGNLFSQNQRGN